MPLATNPSKRKQFNQAWVWLILAAFIWLQLLGTAHRYLHSKVLDVPVAAADWLPSHVEAHSNEQYQDKSSNSTCQLFDLACSGVALASVHAGLMQDPAAMAFTLQGVSPPLAIVFWAYLARGPPTLI